jgi:predicted ATP-dependent endonuclease of OLD family
MHIKFVEITNFRKLKSVRVEFHSETTLFVGANNSGKTSAMAALEAFLVSRGDFTANDFTLSNWATINNIGKGWEAKPEQAIPKTPLSADWGKVLPSMDLWLEVGPDEIHYINHVLPTLDWTGGLLGVRLRFEPKNVESLRQEYLAAINKVKEILKASANASEAGAPGVALWPRTLREFLERHLLTHLQVKTYTLDPAKLEAPQNGVALPQELPPDSEPVEGNPLEDLIRIDKIRAQREFSDVLSAASRRTGSSQRQVWKLTAQLRTYYEKHLNPQKSPEASDLHALQAIQQAEKLFDEKLKLYFSPALKEVEGLGYPGLSDPKLTIATKIRLTDGLDHDAAVQYDVIHHHENDKFEPMRLPENCNGLGYQNLISIVFELMSFRDEWMRVGKAAAQESGEAKIVSFPPPVHLVLIEEPEAHLHAQVQQVFIRKAYDLLRKHTNLGTNPKLATQLIISTHSSHIANESSFESLRYFRRHPASGAGEVPITTVVNLSTAFGGIPETERFASRYLKATHCDLFFADAAIFVEGPAERILVPQFIEWEFPVLRKSYLTLLEIGGSHAHRLRPLIDALGLLTLVITDLDAADSKSGDAVRPVRGQKLVTTNPTLKEWLPKKELIDDLLTADNKIKLENKEPFFSVRVAYQTPLQLTLRAKSPSKEIIPSTFEDALTYANLDTFKNLKDSGPIKKIREAIDQAASNEDLAQKMFEILRKAKKAELALDLLYLEQDPWPIVAPNYMREGFIWLEEQLGRKQEEMQPLVETLLAQPQVTK